MKCKPKMIPFLTFGSGIVLFLLRLWLIATGLDERNLLRPEHPANALSFLVLAVGLGLLYLCLRPLSGKPAYQKLFSKSPFALFGSVLGSISILITVFRDYTDVADKATLLCCVLGVAAAVGLLIAGILQWQGKRPSVVCHSLVALFLMVYLVCRYRHWSAEPELQEYFFQLLASVFLMLTAYYRACLDALVGSRRQFVFFNYASVLLCFSALPQDNWVLYAGLGFWCATCSCSLKPEKEMDLPKDVRFCLKRLEDIGFEAYVVGGCVRDSLLGLVPQDYDMCTNATPKEIAQVFQKYELVRNGEKHGTIGVVIHNTVYEITTFRTEGTYSDSRHPDWVEFVKSLQEDLSRRDFTVNAMAYSPSTGFIDLFGGQNDLKKHILRTVGDPGKRFTEDALRILRGVRFAVRFDLTPEANTFQAMVQLAPSMEKLAVERVFSELCKLLPLINAQQLLEFAPVLTAVIPEMKACMNFDQYSPHHAYDVYTHTAYVVQSLPADVTLRWAGLLHDIAKPYAFTRDENGRGHFYEHARLGSQMAEKILQRLKAPTALKERVAMLIDTHMTPLMPDKKLLRRYLSKWGEDALSQLLELQKADFLGKGVQEESAPDFEEIQALLNEILAENACLSLKDLAVTGKDLLALGAKAGPQLGACLNYLLEQVLDEALENEKPALLQAAQQFLQNNQEG